MSCDEVTQINGRDHRGFKYGGAECWKIKMKDAEAKGLWECCVK